MLVSGIANADGSGLVIIVDAGASRVDKVDNEAAESRRRHVWTTRRLAVAKKRGLTSAADEEGSGIGDCSMISGFDKLLRIHEWHF